MIFSRSFVCIQSPVFTAVGLFAQTRLFGKVIVSGVEIMLVFNSSSSLAMPVETNPIIAPIST